ncbi:hypothetical protein XBKQ1_2790024 [Xenorhabdus bovienii str. kraussei Quebec]|uniref:Uncharacterized protein n=1 Tax=Xenorhabdus bovienii str. kraussei Quebec TaxID=1398203 RepID=A0A077PJM8_XENBV|nr:hypothetical protein XBKQ1_2790024 [Xenorhabdus bovienii str. kraussei Quebec]
MHAFNMTNHSEKNSGDKKKVNTEDRGKGKIRTKYQYINECNKPKRYREYISGR